MPVIQPRPGITEIVPYVPGNVDTLEPNKVTYLASNESPLGASPLAIEAFHNCGQSLHQYPDGSSLNLREAIAAAHGISAEHIICGAGSERLIDLLTRAYAGPGDEVLYSQYGFIMYPICSHAAGATPVTAEETAFTVNVDALLDKVSEKTKIVFLANPNNPTGTYINASEVHRLRSELRQDILLVIDSAYAEYVEQTNYSAGHEFIANGGNNCVVLHTFSKIYGLAAVRLGWAYCPMEIADILNRIRGSFNINAPAQAAGIAALQDTEHTAKAKQHNNIWLPWLHQALSEIGLNVIPSAGNFVLAQFSSVETCQDAHKFLFQNGIIVRPVAGYGLPDALRITIGLEQQNQLCVEALQAFIAQQLT
jgi:histidinol-phosphate aminotransferase